jgi:protein-tyrosine-phosphatase
MRLGTAHVLFVCKGNLCRSPMAMALLQHRLARRGEVSAVLVDSAGYLDWIPFPREAHPFARRAVAELCGEDLLADHVARCWSPEMVTRVTRVVVAEEWMRTDFPAEQVLTLRELGRERGDVADPYGGDYSCYVDCAAQIDRLIAAGMPLLVP